MKCQSKRCWSLNSKLAFAFCSGESETRNLFAASAITAPERIRARPSMTDQVTSDNATTQDNANAASFNGFIFVLRVRFVIQDLGFDDAVNLFRLEEHVNLAL